MKIEIKDAGLDNEAKDVVIDRNFKLHIKRSDCGYVVEALDNNGFSLGIEEWDIWDEDLEAANNLTVSDLHTNY